MKTTRRPFLEPVRNPSGAPAFIKSLDERVSKIERAPVRATELAVPPTTKPIPATPEPPPLPDVGAPLYVIAPTTLPATNHYYQMNLDGTWSIMADTPPPNPRSLTYGPGSGVMAHCGDLSRVSTDKGATFNTRTMPGTTQGIEIRRAADGTLWLLAEDGSLDHVYKSTDNGVTWNLSSDFGLAPSGWQQLGIHPTDNLHVARSFSTGGGNGKVWLTADGGATWQQDGVIDPGVASMSLWFWTATNRLIAAQQYISTTEIIIRYSDNPVNPSSFFGTNLTAYVENLSASGLSANRWMLWQAASGPIFLGLACGGTALPGTRILRSTDNGTTWKACAVTPWVFPNTGDLRGLTYDPARDRLYILFQASGQVFWLGAASTCDFTTVALTDWTELPALGFGLGGCVDVMVFDGV